MNLRNRIKRIENLTNTTDVCRCHTNDIAATKEAFINPARCVNCRGIIKPSVLVVADLSDTANFNYPVKIYAGFDASLI